MAHDQAGVNHATLSNGGWASGAACKVGSACLSLVGGGYASVPLPTGLPLGGAARTVALWVNPSVDLTVQPEGALLQYGTASGNQLFSLITSANAPGKAFWWDGSPGFAGFSTLPQGQWTHLAVTYDGTTVRLYVAGAWEGQSDRTLNTTLDADGLTIGLRPGLNSTWTGLLDDLRIYDRALSDAEVAALAGSNGLNTLTVVDGDQQQGFVDQALPTNGRVRLTNPAGAPLANAPLSFSASPGAAILNAPATTDANGEASFTLQLGRSEGAQSFSVLAPGASATLTATATARPAGTVYTVLNASHARTQLAGPGPATTATLFDEPNLAVAADGTVYFTMTNPANRIGKVDPAGALTLLPGVTSGVVHLALDAAGTTLFWDDSSPNISRRDLATNTDTLLASGYVLLGVGPDGQVYVSGSGGLHKLDPSTGAASDVIVWPGSCAAPLASGDIRAVAWDPLGQLYVVGVFCGSAVGDSTGNNAQAYLVRQNLDGSLTPLSGLDSLPGDGVAIGHARVFADARIAFDPAGNLYLREPRNQPGSNQIYRVDGSTGRLSLVAGTGATGGTGDDGPALAATFSSIGEFGFDAQRNLYLVDRGSYAVRVVAQAGEVTPIQAQLQVVGGDAQNPWLDDLLGLPLQAQLTDGAGDVLTGYPVLWSVQERGAVVLSSRSETDGGVAEAQGRVGPVPGDQHYTARFLDLHGQDIPGSPATFTEAAQAPAQGTIFTLVNVAHLNNQGDQGFPGPATTASVRSTYAMATDSDGGVYFSDSNALVLYLSADGYLSVAAGGGSLTADGTPASQFYFANLAGLALDPVRQRLYMGEEGNNGVSRVYVLDLQTNTVSLFAGSGSQQLFPDGGAGDNGPATQASLSPRQLSVSPNGDLYINDRTTSGLRKIDPTSGIITAVLRPNLPGGCGAHPGEFQGCNWTTEGGCHLAWDSTGTAYFTGALCANGSSPEGAYLLKLTGPNGYTPVFNGQRLITTGPVAVDGADNVYVADEYNGRIYRVSPGGAPSMVVGYPDGGNGDGGDYGPAADAVLRDPADLKVTADGHLLISDSLHGSVRIVW